jgi:hypothetical protein
MEHDLPEVRPQLAGRGTDAARILSHGPGGLDSLGARGLPASELLRWRMDTNPTIPAGARHLYDTALPRGVLSVWKFGPKHYYGTVRWSGDSKERVTRRVTAAEIAADKWTWANYSPGDATERHYAAEDVKQNALKMKPPDMPVVDECDLAEHAEDRDDDDPAFACEALGSRWTVGFCWNTGEAFLMRDGRRATLDEQADLDEVRPDWLYEAAEVVVHYLGLDPDPHVVIYWWDDPSHRKWMWPWSQFYRDSRWID